MLPRIGRTFRTASCCDWDTARQLAGTPLLHKEVGMKALSLFKGLVVFGFLVGSSVHAATLEIPSPNAVMSGVGVISGWKCDAGELTIRFDGGPSIPLVYGSQRPDVLQAGVCPHDRVGFVSIWNWGELGDGQHTAVVYDNGVEFARSTFIVSSAGQAFLRNVMGRGEAVLSNGQRAMLAWAEASQGFIPIAFTDVPDERICTTKTGIARYMWDSTVQTARVTVTNPCDGVTLDFTMTALTDFSAECHELILVQPPSAVKDTEEAHTYGGHGYATIDAYRGENVFVTRHQPGNTKAICYGDLAAGETRTFRVSVDPERVDNRDRLSFLEPFRIYFGEDRYEENLESALLLTFP